MFATLLGALPQPRAEGASDLVANSGADQTRLDELIRIAVHAQEAAGLEPITDGRLRDPTFERLAVSLARRSGVDEAEAITVDWWRFASGQTERAVKQALPGPYTLGRRLRSGSSDPGDAPAVGAREPATARIAEGLRQEVEALAAAGCPLVEIEEVDAHLIGDDERERRIFRDAHRRLTDGIEGTHLSLSIVGGSADKAGVETLLDAPYKSFAFDLIAGPENWNLVTSLAGDRGVIAGVLSAREAIDEPKEIMVWAAHYAASSGGRGVNRVGLGSAGSYANLTWESAVRKMGRLGDVARLAGLPPSEELARELDPRAVSSRRAALGHDAPPRPRGRRR